MIMWTTNKKDDDTWIIDENKKKIDDEVVYKKQFGHELVQFHVSYYAGRYIACIETNHDWLSVGKHNCLYNKNESFLVEMMKKKIESYWNLSNNLSLKDNVNIYIVKPPLKNQEFVRCLTCNHRIPIYKGASMDMCDDVYCCNSPYYCRE